MFALPKSSVLGVYSNLEKILSVFTAHASQLKRGFSGRDPATVHTKLFYVVTRAFGWNTLKYLSHGQFLLMR